MRKQQAGREVEQPLLPVNSKNVAARRRVAWRPAVRFRNQRPP